MDDIIGLPAIVSARYRIVIDKSIRHLFHMPEDGAVQVIVGIDQIQIFPGKKQVKGAVLKDFSKGRFNLPIEWARRNDVRIGGRVFLITASDCVLVRPSVHQKLLRSADIAGSSEQK